MSNRLLCVEKMNKTAGQRSHLYLGPKVYSFLPENLRSYGGSIHGFKRECKTFILDIGRSQIHELFQK